MNQATSSAQLSNAHKTTKTDYDLNLAKMVGLTLKKIENCKILMKVELYFYSS